MCNDLHIDSFIGPFNQKVKTTHYGPLREEMKREMTTTTEYDSSCENVRKYSPNDGHFNDAMAL